MTAIALDAPLDYAGPQTRVARAADAPTFFDRHALWFVLGLMILLGCVTGPRVFHAALWGDEFRTWRDGIEKPLSVVLLWHHNPDHAPLGHLMARAGAAIFGVEHAWALRLGSWLCGLACVPAMWWMGRTIWSSFAGLLMALMFVVDPNIGYQMTQARMYAPLMLAGTCAITLAGSLVIDPTRPARRVVLLGVAIGVGIWSHGSIHAITIALILVGVGLLFSKLRRRAGVLLLLGVLLGCGIGAQGVIKLIGRHDAESVAAPDIDGTPRQQLRTAVVSLAGKSGVAALILGATIVGIVVIGRRRGYGPVAALLALIVVMTVVNLFVAARYRPIAHPRYLTVLQPPLWLAMAVLVVELGRSRHRWTLGSLSLGILLTFSGIGFARLLDDLREDPQARPFGEVARAIARSIQPGDRFVPVPRFYGFQSRYYGLHIDEKLEDAISPQSSPRIGRLKVAQAHLERGTIWLLCVRQPAKAPPKSWHDSPVEVARRIATARNLDAAPVQPLARPKKWRGAAVRIDDRSAAILHSWDSDGEDKIQPAP